MILNNLFLKMKSLSSKPKDRGVKFDIETFIILKKSIDNGR